MWQGNQRDGIAFHVQSQWQSNVWLYCNVNFTLLFWDKSLLWITAICCQVQQLLQRQICTLTQCLLASDVNYWALHTIKTNKRNCQTLNNNVAQNTVNWHNLDVCKKIINAVWSKCFTKYIWATVCHSVGIERKKSWSSISLVLPIRMAKIWILLLPMILSFCWQ